MQYIIYFQIMIYCTSDFINLDLTLVKYIVLQILISMIYLSTLFVYLLFTKQML